MLTLFAIFKALKIVFSSIKFKIINLTLFVMYLKTQTCLRIKLNSKSNGLVLILNNKFRDCFLSFFAADGKDGH